MQRAYTLLDIKSIDEDARIIEGLASTPATDRMGDIVEPRGAEFKLPLPFLWQHRSTEPIGHVTKAKVTADGITVRVELVKWDEPGELKNLLDKAWGMIKTGLVRGLSIGFDPIEDTDIKGSFGKRFIKWEWLELSAVTIPANVEASIQTVKQFDAHSPASSGPAARVTKSPGASGPVKLIKPGAITVTIREQITQFENTRAAKSAAMDALMAEVAKKGETLDATQAEEYDTLAGEVKSVDEHLARLREQETRSKAVATVVQATDTVTAGAARSGAVVSVKPNVEKGIGFARYAMALLACRGNKYEAADYAKSHWPDQPEVEHEIKAAVASGNTTSATWAGPLALVTPLANEFLELLRPKTLLGRIPGLRKVPFNVSVPAQTSGGTYGWVGEGAAKPVSALAFATVSLPFAKAAGIIVLTKELVKLSTPSAQELVRDDMINGMQQFLDTQFIDPAVAISANVSPASVTNGVTGTAASGTTEAAARADLRALIATFATNNIGLDGVVLVMSETVAFILGTIINAVGQPAFPGIGITGGSILGIPVVTSNVVGAQIVAIHAPSVLYADDGQTEIDVSEQASLQMDGAPTNPTDATTVLVSLWQRNLVGLRADRFVTWLKARANTVQRIHTVAYA